MLVGCDKLYLPLETYSKKLIYLMETYLNTIDIESDEISKKANEKAKIVIRASIFKNKEFIKDYKNIENSIGKKNKIYNIKIYYFDNANIRESCRMLINR